MQNGGHLRYSIKEVFLLLWPHRAATTVSGTVCAAGKGWISCRKLQKRALEASLKKLLLQKPLNKITINDITEDCGVNRMTFYYHFKDIYDLVDWIMVEDAAKALEGRQSFENWTDAFLDILHQVQDNKVLVMNVYRSVSREQVEQYLYKLLDHMLRDFVDRSAQGFTVQDSDKQFIIDFLQIRAGGHGTGMDPQGYEGGSRPDDRAAECSASWRA